MPTLFPSWPLVSVLWTSTWRLECKFGSVNAVNVAVVCVLILAFIHFLLARFAPIAEMALSRTKLCQPSSSPVSRAEMVKSNSREPYGVHPEQWGVASTFSTLVGDKLEWASSYFGGSALNLIVMMVRLSDTLLLSLTLNSSLIKMTLVYGILGPHSDRTWSLLLPDVEPSEGQNKACPLFLRTQITLIQSRLTFYR